jgi:hypothetical protein
VGGVIAEGSYLWSGWCIYTGPGGAAGFTGAAESRVRTFTNGTMETVVTYSGNVQGAGVVGRSTATYAVSGAELTFTFGCRPPGAPSAMTAPYTVDGNDLKIYTTYTTLVDGAPAGTTVHENVLTRR